VPGEPVRGEVWLVNLDPTVGREQAGERPVVIVSTDRFNRGPAGLVIVVPMTTRDRQLLLHVSVDPPEGGVQRRSFVKCEDVRSISKDRLSATRWGALSHRTMAEVEDRLRILLDL
jgi:mRNA interferase MazF